MRFSFEVLVSLKPGLSDPQGKAVADARINLRTDSSGAVLVRFTLPAQIERGEATLSVGFSDGASVETIVRPIPVVLKKLNVEFFPEGGDLVLGAQAGESRLAEVFRKAGFTRFRRAAETPFNLILEARAPLAQRTTQPRRPRVS